MRELIYKCNRCGQQISGTVHCIGATDEHGNETKYGSLLENIDLCEKCMEQVTLALMADIDRANQEEQTETTEGQQNKTDARQQDRETQEDTEKEIKTYQCSKVIKTCAYAEKVGGALACGYISIEGHRRGCEPEACDKYKKIVKKSGRKPKEAKQESAQEIVEG